MSRVEALREELGGVHPGAAKKVKDHLDDYLAGFISNSPFAVLATSNATGDCDASPKGGLPGFIKIVDERTLLIPDLGGNRLFQSYENFETNSKAGLIFMIPGMSVTVRVNGEQRHRGVAPRTFSTLMLTLPRNDAHLLFDARIDL